ncbi:heterokaryon incompatibility protein-domain-containing protein [Coniochaeta sp. 2T2.1]|nr:heterokaryon incompatibility protein-domain-containing protein [Coniochaeta sp. 2T2.1]
MAHSYQSEAINPTDEFRILRLKPGAEDDALSGDIITARFGDEVEYEALSYAWGSDVKTRQLSTPRGVLPITEFLASALRCLRRSDDDLLIWADAVCINQGDNQEKNHQVRRIRDIFAGAEMVRVHLGDERDNSELVPGLLEVLTTVDLQKEYNLDPAWDRYTRHIKLLERLKAYDHGPLPALDDPSWRALQTLFRRPWFKRVWVIQEYVVAKDVTFHCGRWSIRSCVLRDALEKLYHDLIMQVYTSKENSDGETVEGIVNSYMSVILLFFLRKSYKNGRELRLVELLQKGRSKLATRSRDHLFALLGLANDAGDPAFDPDYEEPLAMVVRRYASAIVKQGHGAYLLEDAGVVPGAPDCFPSWVPYWTSMSDGQETWRVLGREILSRNVYSAGGEHTSHMSDNNDHTTLTTRASIFDTIAKVGTSGGDRRYITGTAGSEIRESVNRWFDEALAMTSELVVYPTGEPLGAALRRSIIADLCYDDARVSRPSVSMYDRIRRTHGDEELNLEYQNFTHVFAIHRLMRFCITEKGYMGLCSTEARVGDDVYILPGMQTPYTMRRTAGRQDNELRLVGRCYIHGIMDGEALTLPGYEPKDIHNW